MKKYIFSFFLLPSILFAQKIQVDLIVYNAVVYTVNPSFEIAEAFAVKNNVFVAVGKSTDILQKYTTKQQIDAKGKAIFPGLYDPHSHFMELGQVLSECNLVDTKSFADVVERLKIFSKQNPKAKWIIGRGWDQNDWETKQFPSKESLDIAFQQTPVALTRIDGHALVVNSTALKMANITSATKVEGGLIELKNGEPTGVLLDNAMSLIYKLIPKPSEEQQIKMLLMAQKECFKVGLTTITDAGIDQKEIELIDKLQKENILKIRDYAMISLSKENLSYYLQKGIYKSSHLNVRSFKLYADGALGSRGACLLKPYSDQPTTSGFLLSSPTKLAESLELISKSPFQANTHCIGDSANRLILDLYGNLLQTKNDRRWRIEHAQIVSRQDLPKFKKYSIIPSIQTTHATSDMYWAGDRLGTSRIKTAYTYKDLLNQNGFIANGSDFPVENVNPLFGFHSAIARQDAKNFPKGGFQIENALSREEALKAMTIWAAYANFEEKERGSIEKEKMADFIILENDIMKISPEKIRSTKVLGTFVGGEKVF